VIPSVYTYPLLLGQLADPGMGGCMVGSFLFPFFPIFSFLFPLFFFFFFVSSLFFVFVFPLKVLSFLSRLFFFGWLFLFLFVFISKLSLYKEKMSKDDHIVLTGPDVT